MAVELHKLGENPYTTANRSVVSITDHVEAVSRVSNGPKTASAIVVTQEPRAAAPAVSVVKVTPTKVWRDYFSSVLSKSKRDKCNDLSDRLLDCCNLRALTESRVVPNREHVLPLLGRAEGAPLARVRHEAAGALVRRQLRLVLGPDDPGHRGGSFDFGGGGRLGNAHVDQEHARREGYVWKLQELWLCSSNVSVDKIFPHLDRATIEPNLM